MLNSAMSSIIAFAETVSNALGKIFGWKFEVGAGGKFHYLQNLSLNLRAAYGRKAVSFFNLAFARNFEIFHKFYQRTYALDWHCIVNTCTHTTNQTVTF